MKPKKKEKKIIRTRRTAGEPDPFEDPSRIPHKRVHRVQSEDDIPHSRNPREFQVIHDSEVAFSEVPFRVEPFPPFQFPVFQSERIAASGNPSREYSPAPRNRGGVSRKVEVRTSDDDFIVPDSQRFYPTFNPRVPPSIPPSRPPFFSPSPSGPRTPGPRGGRFNGHGPGFRGSPSIRDNGSFREFHNSFYGPGAREAITRPEFAFPSSRQPLHREKEYLDNTLLGSGNFEVLRGGTFYDEDDPEIHHGYDHLLHDGYYGSQGDHNAPHTNNHVDDFFSNFRDFSEFAARRSDEGETLDDVSFYSQGYASEHIPQVIDKSHPDFQDAIDKRKVQDDTVQEGKKTEKTVDKQIESDQTMGTKGRVLSKDNSRHKEHKKHRRPKNIQEVLEDLEAQPSENFLSSLPIDEKDPMIAMF